MTQNKSQQRAADNQPDGPDVWVTGIGLISSLGGSAEAHWQALGEHGDAGRDLPAPVIDETTFAPYPCHPLAPLDLSTQIPRKGDLRQMGKWQQIGVYAAGLALEDAGLAGDQELLDQTHMIVAAGNGERDSAADRTILQKLDADDCANASPGTDTAPDGMLNDALQSTLRPTLYLAELSNLLSGNISIVHGVTASSRTFKGEEMAGVCAIEDAVRRIRSGQNELFLVGGASNGERADMMLSFELSQNAWSKPWSPVWERAVEGGGGLIPGSVGAFLVLEAAPHAKARGRTAYAKISNLYSSQNQTAHEGGKSGQYQTQKSSDLLKAVGGLPISDNSQLAVLSGATGAHPATIRELNWLDSLPDLGLQPYVRAYGSHLGAALEAHFPAGIALAALAAKAKQFYRPFDTSGHEAELKRPVSQILVSGRGHCNGIGLALVEAIDAH